MITYTCDSCDKKIEGLPLGVFLHVTNILQGLWPNPESIAQLKIDLCKTCHDGLKERDEVDRLLRVAALIRRRAEALVPPSTGAMP